VKGRNRDDSRARSILRLGSELSAAEPGEEFAARLQARLAVARAGSRSPTWADAVGLVGRPALALAGLLVVAILVWSGWSSDEGDALVALAGGEGTFDSVQVNGLDVIVPADVNGDAVTEDAP
jgi:hypothetical protein